MMKELLTQLAAILDSEPPLAFRKMRPLKRGAYEDMLARYPNVDQDKLAEWFSVWCRQKGYVNKIANGKPRHDLDGRFVSGVSDQDVADAKLRIQLTAVYASRGLIPVQSERRCVIVEFKRKRIVRAA
jgi:sRNA-binding protein